MVNHNLHFCAAVDGTNAGVVAVASWTGALMLLSGLLLLFMS